MSLKLTLPRFLFFLLIVYFLVYFQTRKQTVLVCNSQKFPSFFLLFFLLFQNKKLKHFCHRKCSTFGIGKYDNSILKSRQLFRNIETLEVPSDMTLIVYDENFFHYHTTFGPGKHRVLPSVSQLCEGILITSLN